MGAWLLLGLWLGGGAAAWTPPAKPDPQAILEEANGDAEAGRHARALAKHEWVHRESLKADPAFYGVRLSFALSSWVELGRSYPPALESLVRFRDEALAQVLSGEGSFAPFHDFVAINEHLDDEARTREAFLRIDKEKPELAKELYDLAEPALVEGKEYAVCGRYIQADQRWARIASFHATAKTLDELGPQHREYVEKKLVQETGQLIALLMLNRRTSEAERIARKARTESDEPAFQAAIDAALTGTVPVPYP
jgi:hypothetical protein